MSEDSNQSNINMDGWRIFDLPVKYATADYDEARIEIVNKISQIPGIIALFEWGYIPVPGISDMDFRAVFADDAPYMYVPRKPALSEKTKYLMEHNVFIISEKHYRKVLYFDPWTTNIWPNGHRLLWQKEGIGRDLNFEKINFPQDEKNILSMGRIEEALEGVFSLIPFYIKKELSVRSVFEVLKDCVYMIREINAITDRKIDPSFSQDFQNLRLNWFKLGQKEGVKKLIEIFHRGMLVSFEISFSLGDWLSKHARLMPQNDLSIKKTDWPNCSYLDKKARNIYLSTFGEKRVFTDSVKTPQQALKLSLDSFRKFKDFYIIFQPFNRASMLLGLVREQGLLSDHLRKDIWTNQCEVPVLESEAFRKKNRMINEITELYDKKQIIGVGGKGWIFGNNRFGYLFKQEGFKRKLLNFLMLRNFWRIINQAQ
ncbi:MAG: hypothetical protein ABH841_02475 [Candidatus Nealsonbacteria bacterium]